jgi:uncharacterized protein
MSFTSIDGIPLAGFVHGVERPRGVAVLVHGISTEMDEGGMYVRLGERLREHGVAVVRFSFRGHGRSAGTQRGVTVAGEMLDVEAVVERARVLSPDVPLALVASSFGAVSALETASYLRPDLLVLWNPILDLRRTFLTPDLPWGRRNFNDAARQAAQHDGVLLLDSEFAIGRVLLAEFGRYRPGDRFAATDMPALVVHAEHDTYVSYPIARGAAAARGADFNTVRGSDHGFDTVEQEDEAVTVTVSWLNQHVGPTPP